MKAVFLNLIIKNSPIIPIIKKGMPDRANEIDLYPELSKSKYSTYSISFGLRYYCDA